MLNLLIAVLSAVVTYALTTLLFESTIVGIFPALLIFGVVAALLMRRTSAVVATAAEPVMQLMQAGKVAEAEQLLLGIKSRYARWQFFLSGQIDAQLGLMRYMQLKFDEAAPLLESGKWRNWTALMCLGCIAWRKGDKATAVERFADAESASSKEAMVYAVWATLLARDKQREQALQVIGRGLAVLEDSQVLRGLQKTVANKKRIKTQRFPQAWGMFFPEDALKQMAVRGRRGPQEAPEGVAVRYQQGPPQPKMGKKARRGR